MKGHMRLLLTGALCVAPPLAFADDDATNQAIDQAFGDHAHYQAVIQSLQKGVGAHDPAGVARLIRYPLNVSMAGRKMNIQNAKAFIANYDAIMTPDIVAAVRNQKYENLFVNSQGVMFGDGQVWIAGVCSDNTCKTQDVKVITIQHSPK
jgi:hypothetical protein